VIEAEAAQMEAGVTQALRNRILVNEGMLWLSKVELNLLLEERIYQIEHFVFMNQEVNQIGSLTFLIDRYFEVSSVDLH
jgi:hypothetical protein